MKPSDDEDEPAGRADRSERAASTGLPTGPMVRRSAANRTAPRARRIRSGRDTLGLAVLVVLVLVCGGLVLAVLDKAERDAAFAAREAAEYTPPPVGASGATEAGRIVAIISDENASRAASGVAPAERWPRLLGPRLGAAVSSVAIAGAGYATSGAGGRTFEDAVSDIPTDAGAVVFVGGAADADSTTIAVARAATRAFAAAKERAPDAAVIAVGPLYVPSSVTSAQIEALRSALASSAQLAEVPWVDPVRSGWLDGVDSTGDLSPDVELTIADRIRTVVDSAPVGS